MFGSSKRNSFKPSVYEPGRRRRKRMPRWLVILFTGVIIGTGGYWFLQTNYGPERLTTEESSQLQQTIHELKQERNTLKNQVDELSYDINQNQSELSKLKDADKDNLTTIESLKKELELVKGAIPPDPSNNVVGIRGANLQGDLGKISYELLLMNRADAPKEIKAEMDFNIEGRYRNRNIGYSEVKDIEMTSTEFSQIKGEVTLNQETLTPHKVVITIREAGSNKVLGKRTFEVQH